MTTIDLLRAQLFAIEAHGKQVRRASGLPYVVHVVRVALNVAHYYELYATIPLEHHLSFKTLACAALLHDTIEDTDTTLVEITREFGEEIAKLVEELTSDPVELEKVGKCAYLQQKVCTISVEALFIKLCDRLDNLTDYLNGCSKTESVPRASSYSQQTLHILAVVPQARLLAFAPLIKQIADTCTACMQTQLFGGAPVESQ